MVCGAADQLTVLKSKKSLSEVGPGLLFAKRLVRGHVHHRPAHVTPTSL